MINIAIVDDEENFISEIKSYVQSYGEESKETFNISEFCSGMDFITNYRPVYDIVFLDIEMPLIDGMTVAHKLRELDEKIAIVFITRMRQYAIEGYEVDAVDFLIKPVKKFHFIDKLKKAINYSRAHREEEICVKTEGQYYRVFVSKIDYIEKDKNYLVYHIGAKELRARGALNHVEQELMKYGFSRCSSGCLVNLRNIQKMSTNELKINGTTIPIARQRTVKLKSDLLEFLRGGGGKL